MSPRSTSSSPSSHSTSPKSGLTTSAPSSPPQMDDEIDPDFANDEERALIEQEKKAQLENEKAEKRRQAAARRKRKGADKTRAEREEDAKKLEDLLKKSAAFSEILTKKTEVLGRVGSGFDGKALGEHDLELATQPESMTGGTMRDYQLEGLTWMFEICSQGMSGILADEMGLGKTIQTISLLAKLREVDYLGPFVIIAPLSTLSNWRDEFNKWVPSMPVAFYHGAPAVRNEVFRKSLLRNIVKGKVNEKFPVVLTTPEIVLRDASDLATINWEIIFIDEGHRLKNSDSKLFHTLQTFRSVTRFLITGTPLQNNLKELWSLLHFLLPTIFQHWEQFESWFDFSDLQDEEGTEEFLQDKYKQELVKKMHLILQPMLLRRIKADVEHLLPKKREYVLYAPMTKEQTDLYNVINNKTIDTRQYLEDKVVERLTGATNTPAVSRKVSPSSVVKAAPSDSEDDVPLSKLALRGRSQPYKDATPKSAFQKMMQRKPSAAKPAKGKKRKSEQVITPAPKSAKSSRSSTPATSIRGRKTRGKKIYAEAHSSDEDALSDDEFEQMIADEVAEKEAPVTTSDTPEELERAKTLELAKKEISNKKLGNPIMQLRLTCNSPHNFYNPWSSESGLEVDETLVTSSGKMLLLDRLLPELFAHGHKVLIFSQFKTQLDILEDYARELRRWPVCRLDGSVSQESRQAQIAEFNTSPAHKLFLLSTRAGGQGINLASADTVILYDSDWNPQQDLQAQDRAHRIGQQNPVIIYRLATRGTVEETLLLSADAKRRLEKLVIKKGGFRSLGQKLRQEGAEEEEEGMDEEALKQALLLKDGEVFRFEEGAGVGERVLSESDLRVLCDRSEEAYVRAEKGLGDSAGFKIVETKVGGLMMGMKGSAREGEEVKEEFKEEES